MVDFRLKVSPVMGISGGSIETSLHTFFNFLAKRFLRWSCLPIVNPARGQRRAWLGLNDSPQTHLVARAKVRYWPSVSKGKAVSKALFVEDEIMFFDGLRC